MATIQVIVCDICRSQTRATKRFQIREDGTELVDIELCDKDAAPLRRMMRAVKEVTPLRTAGATQPSFRAEGKPARKAATTNRRKRTGFDAAVTSMEEIEASKSS